MNPEWFCGPVAVTADAVKPAGTVVVASRKSEVRGWSGVIVSWILNELVGEVSEFFTVEVTWTGLRMFDRDAVAVVKDSFPDRAKAGAAVTTAITGTVQTAVAPARTTERRLRPGPCAACSRRLRLR